MLRHKARKEKEEKCKQQESIRRGDHAVRKEGNKIKMIKDIRPSF